MELNEVLNQREEAYGSFECVARVSQELKGVMYESLVSDKEPEEYEALEMILHKIARIICSKYVLLDEYRDIAGYAMLVLNSLENQGLDNNFK
jgi:hypothetical protein